ncbi:MAG: hypothetical protein DWQ18_04635 [Crenarchaeota archaeon]|nr:MAG: hypothetical protein DWQ17_08495 [Thermoproteota archaeon]RDJ34186.1 MAG: hypothetical protein DWQ18_04635 [Thermoproteota archaeon]RDJ36699.1 MAG: hypothetical protein DWQ13_05975 [Thermoproteota archaeon]RDJ37768.1 MAG: hypothetical protein DWQ19_04860 [Thermoproteota archaeon]
MSELDIPDEFIEENKNNLKFAISKIKRSGPYPKNQKQKRRMEVHRLHFDYGYSARKIAEMMKVNRNTINGDISFWYSKLVTHYNLFDPEASIILKIARFEEQRIRLREQLDKVTEFNKKICLEKMIFDIDYKILQTHQRLTESTLRIQNNDLETLNYAMERKKLPERYTSMLDAISVSKKAQEKIDKIITEDRKKLKIL